MQASGVIWRKSITHSKDGKHPGFGHRVEPDDNFYIERDVTVSMRDGAKLYVDILRPKTEAKVPVILTYGPYGKLKEFLLSPASGVPASWVSKYAFCNRERSYRGGIPETKTVPRAQWSTSFSLTRSEEFVETTREHPLLDHYWRARSAVLRDIKVPAHQRLESLRLAHSAAMGGGQRVNSGRGVSRVEEASRRLFMNEEKR